MKIEENGIVQTGLSGGDHLLILRDGTQSSKQGPLLNEHIIKVMLNGRSAMELVCVPQFLAEFILGKLLTDGLIRTTDEVDLLQIRENGTRAEVTLNAQAPTAPLQIKPVTALSWQPEWIFRLADRFADGMPLHQATWATHSCFLMRQGEILFSCEDIGRHNALDKAIGHALRNGIPLDECIVYSSGRIPTDMVRKAIRAGIPVLVSKAAPTAQAVALARKYGLTLICSARRDSMRLFTE